MPPKFPKPSVRLPGRLGRTVGQQLNAGSSAGAYTEYELQASEITIRHPDDLTGIQEATGFAYYGSDGQMRFRMRNGVNTALGDGSVYQIASKAANATDTTGRTSIQLRPTYWDGSASQTVRFILRGDITATTPAASFTVAIHDLDASPLFGQTVLTVNQDGNLTVPGSLTGASLTVDGYAQSGVVTKYKTSDETLNDTDNVADSNTDLDFTVGASEVWAFKYLLNIDAASTTPDFKYRINAPTGHVGVYWSSYAYGASGSQGTGYSNASTTIVPHTGSQTDFLVVIEGFLVNGASSGSHAFQWAQNSAHASNTVLKAGSCAIFTRLA